MVNKEAILNKALDAIENELINSFSKRAYNYLLDPVALEQSERRLIRDMISRSMDETINKEKKLSSVTDKTSLLIYANESGKFKVIEDKLWSLVLDKYKHPEKYSDDSNEAHYSFMSHNCTQQLIHIKDLISQIKTSIFGCKKPKSPLQIISDHGDNLKQARKQPYQFMLIELELIEEVNNLIIYESKVCENYPTIDELPSDFDKKIMNVEYKITENALVEYNNQLNQRRSRVKYKIGIGI